LSSFFTLFVIALALALPTALAIIMNNASLATGRLSDSLEVTVYFKPDVPLEKVQQLARTAAARTGVARASVLSADDALKEFREYSGFGTALEALEGNPLPHVLSIAPKPDASTPAAVEDLKTFLSAWQEVDMVQVDSDWVRRLDAIIALLRYVVLGAGGLLAVGVLAVIGNTIRLEIQNRRAEIEVTKLVGGTNGFVRRPFLYSGMLYGGGGALLAFVIVFSAAAALGAPVAALAAAYGSGFSILGPGWRELAVLIAVGGVLGWLGAWIAATRHLHRIEPRA
jgi:cell division transport system permease protein